MSLYPDCRYLHIGYRSFKKRLTPVRHFGVGDAQEQTVETRVGWRFPYDGYSTAVGYRKGMSVRTGCLSRSV